MAVLSKRNIVITSFNIFSAVFILFFIGLLAYLSKDLPQTFSEMLINPNVLIPCITVLFSVFSVFFIRKFFLQNTRAEIFFFLIFLLTLNFDGIRPIIYILEQLDKPESYVLILTRIAYFGKILGVFVLLCFALMTINTDYKPFTTLLSAVLLLAMFVAVLLPFNPTKGSNALFIPGLDYFYTALTIIKILTVLTLVFNYVQNRNWEYLNLAVSMIFILTGSHTLFYTASPFGAVLGMALLTTGTVFISYRIHKLYLWN
ncbi:MAG: hypothetical protein IJM77_05900 [Spirochaetia bacterium]|nr:hypothetical protein [Spirochaetia bacterium]MBQ6674130.1 hypothetical protein [Spirochaetia bacterium]